MQMTTAANITTSPPRASSGWEETFEQGLISLSRYEKLVYCYCSLFVLFMFFEVGVSVLKTYKLKQQGIPIRVEQSERLFCPGQVTTNGYPTSQPSVFEERVEEEDCA